MVVLTIPFLFSGLMPREFAVAEPSKDSAVLPDLTQPVTSFGAAIVGESLYLYGGHIGKAHSYSKKEQSNALTRLDLVTKKWSVVVSGPSLQGNSLVAHGGKLYRVGGFTAENAMGEDHDLHSRSFVARFDPDKKSWEDLAPLPEPRSSHDSAVVGESVYVVGGWALAGEEEDRWHTTAWKLDLAGQPLHWQTIADPPFLRRALAAAAHDDKLYVVGGMQKGAGPTAAVAVFDPATNSWSDGPALATTGDGQDSMAGFGASAFATGGRLYVTTANGELQRLDEDGSSWEVIAKTPTARFFHRLLPLDDKHLLVVGGANMETGKFKAIEVIDVRMDETR